MANKPMTIRISESGEVTFEIHAAPPKRYLVSAETNEIHFAPVDILTGSSSQPAPPSGPAAPPPVIAPDAGGAEFFEFHFMAAPGPAKSIPLPANKNFRSVEVVRDPDGTVRLRLRE